jgi:hypothetical protein
VQLGGFLKERMVAPIWKFDIMAIGDPLR